MEKNDESLNPELTRKLLPKKTIKVEDFMGEEEVESKMPTMKKEPKKNLDLIKIVSQFILK